MYEWSHRTSYDTSKNKACENVKVENNVERPAHVEWLMTREPSENEKKGIKSTARHE
jgi:hypothetical protein